MRLKDPIKSNKLRKYILPQWSCCILTFPNGLLQDWCGQEFLPSWCYRLRHWKNKQIDRNILKINRRYESNNPKQMRVKQGLPFQRRETDLCLHALPDNFFCVPTVLTPAHRPTQILLFRMAKCKSRIESDVAKIVVVIWIAIGVWHGPLIGSLCFFIVKLPIQHIDILSFQFMVDLQENENPFWRLWTNFYKCPLSLVVIAWICILHSPKFLLK